MPKVDLILLHSPSVYDFRKKSIMYGPISDVVPSTQIFEMYPIGFMTILEYLQRHGHSVRIINVALKMLRNPKFDVEKLIRSLKPRAFGLDLHWMVHAQGSLELASIVKKHHPDIPIIFGGLSSSYYHKELILYPQVDYVIRGDSTEEPLHQLLSVIKEERSPEHVANLTWKENNQVRINELSYIPSDLNNLSFDYRKIMKSVSKHFDFFGHMPFRDWLDYPIIAALSCRGCTHDCIICGGSGDAYRRICGRNSPAFRKAELLAEDIILISKYMGSPIFILGDILQLGTEYARTLLSKLKGENIKNHIALEFFAPPSRQILELMAESIPNFNMEISPESHDEEIRKTFGRNYTNNSLERSIKDALELGCKRIDIFFMVGLSGQTSESVSKTVDYCGELIGKFGNDNISKIHPYISPLAPFLDPGSLAFENPEKYGFKLFYKTLEEHCQALIQPSWKYLLNYETEWMNRDEIVDATYEAALKLNRIKAKYGLEKQNIAEMIEAQIKEERELIACIDKDLSTNSKKLKETTVEKLKKTQIDQLSTSTICRKDELRWPVRQFKFNLPKIMWDIVLKKL